MTDSLSPVADVYVGVWTNWSLGSVRGVTLTLCSTHANILTNALAMFVTLSNIQLWTIIRYIVHQFGSSTQPELATPHLNQQQRVLRNAGSAFSTAHFMLKIGWKSQKASKKFPLRAYSIGILACLYAVFFMLAVVFSSQAVSVSSVNGGSPVLLRSKACGLWNETYLDIVLSNKQYESEHNFDIGVTHWSNFAHDVQLSLEYAQECYLYQTNPKAADDMSSACNIMKQSNLAWTNSTVACPFSPSICNANSTAVLLETEVFDSYTHFGMNTKPQDRLTYQRKTTCAVLDSADYIEGWDGSVVNASSPRPAAENAHVYYGSNIRHKTNWTYSLSNFASFYDNYTDMFANPYELAVVKAYGLVEGGLSSPDFEPIPELAQADADVILFFLGYSGMYLGPVTDPWFSANREQFFESNYPLLETRYARDTAVSTIGCKEQHQFCTKNGTCTGFLGFDQVQQVQSFNNTLSRQQNTTFNRMLLTMSIATLGDTVEGLQTTTMPLQAVSLIQGGASGAFLSPALFSSQWLDELNYWHSITMAHVQRVIVRWATGQISDDPQNLVPAKEPEDVWFCNNMVVPSRTYQSFSVLVIAIIFVIGTLVIIASLFMQNLATFFRKCLKKSTPSWHWDDDDLLGLPRYARKSLKKPIPPPKDIAPCSTINSTPLRQSNSSSIKSQLSDPKLSSPVLPHQMSSMLPNVGHKYGHSVRQMTEYQITPGQETMQQPPKADGLVFAVSSEQQLQHPGQRKEVHMLFPQEPSPPERVQISSKTIKYNAMRGARTGWI